MKHPVLNLVLACYSLLGFSIASQACIEEGKVSNLTYNKKIYTMTMESGNTYLFVGKKHPLIPMVRNAIQSEKEICITNLIENYPTQLVARFRNFDSPKETSQNCVKKGYIRSVYVNPKYDWFFLEDGFSIRVIHRSNLTPMFYAAAFSKNEVCITDMNLDASGPTWGIPRDALILGR